MTPAWLPGDAEELPCPTSRAEGHRLWQTIALLAAVGAVTGALIETAIARHHPRPDALPEVVAVAPPSSAPHTAPPTIAAQPSVMQEGHAVMGATSDWDLYGLAWGVVVRVQMARGAVTVTSVSAKIRQAEVTFLAGPVGVIVRPGDGHNGYLVPDGAAARPLQGMLGTALSVLPGPSASTAWVLPQNDTGGEGPPELVDLRTERVLSTLRIPDGLGDPVTPDGSGYLLFNGVGGVYDVRPDGVRRVTNGVVLAVGAQGWLTLECDDQFHCTTNLVDRRTGAHRRIGHSPPPTGLQRGVISPDGRFAAYLTDIGVRTEAVHVVDLTTGDDRTLDVSPASAFFGSTPFVWAPDRGHTLLVPDVYRHIEVADAATGDVQGIGVSLPDVMQLAVRSAS
jgi:hypothetical protein